MTGKVVAVKPGLTGLWQVSGRSAVTTEEHIARDLEYVARAGTWLELVVVIETIPPMMVSRGAIYAVAAARTQRGKNLDRPAHPKSPN